MAGSRAKFSQTPSRQAQNLESNRGGFGSVQASGCFFLLHPCWVHEDPCCGFPCTVGGASPPDTRMQGELGRLTIHSRRGPSQGCLSPAACLEPPGPCFTPQVSHTRSAEQRESPSRLHTVTHRPTLQNPTDGRGIWVGVSSGLRSWDHNHLSEARLGALDERGA